MNRPEFFDKVWRDLRDNYEVTKPEVDWWVNAILDELADAILDNPEVRLKGFGSFEKKVSKGHMGSDFSGGLQEIGARERVRFILGKTLKYAVRQGMNAEEYHQWIDRTNALRRGEYVPGWKLKSNYAVRIEDSTE